MEIDEIKKKVLEDVDPQLRSQKKKEMRKARLVISLQFLALAAVILLVFYLMMGFSTVTGNSMYPTLHDKDIVAYFRLGKEYKPGDVIVLERPDGEEFVKRVVAVAGDTVNIQSGKVYVNGEEAKFKGTLGKTDGLEAASSILWWLKIRKSLSWEITGKYQKTHGNLAR